MRHGIRYRTVPTNPSRPNKGGQEVSGVANTQSDKVHEAALEKSRYFQPIPKIEFFNDNFVSEIAWSTMVARNAMEPVSIDSPICENRFPT